MIRRKRLSLLRTFASATSILSATSASAILSIAGASLLLAASVSAQAQSTATVTITTAGTLHNISVLTQGATGLDYTVFTPSTPVVGACAIGHAYAVSDTCTVQFSFTPTHPWVRYGGISLFDNADHLLGNVFLNGVGTVPQVSYPLSAASTATALGSGASSPFGVAVDGNGNIYAADPSGPKVYELIAVNGVVPTTNPTIITLGSGFTSPSGVAVDGSGNVYVADTGGNAVKELVAVGGSVPATNPAIVPLATGYTFSQPKGVAVDSSGNVYVADTGNGVVVELKATDGVIPSNVTPTVLNSTTPANIFSQPSGIAVDASGNVYVADTNHSAVKKLAASSGTVTPGTTPTTVANNLGNVSGVAIDGSGDLYVAYAGGNATEIVMGSGATIPLGSGFTALGGVAVDASGNVYVTDTESGHSLVKELNAQNPPNLTFTQTAVGTTSSDSPQTLTVANNGNAPLLFAVPTTGSNPSVSINFSRSSSSTCPLVTTSASGPGSLAAGASCTEAVSFTPTRSGSLTGSLTTTDNAAGSPRSVSLSGTSTAAPTSVSVAGTLTVYASATITATVTNAPGTINPNGSADGSVTFTVVHGSIVESPLIVPLSGGTASYPIAKVLPVNYTVTAAYSGSPNFLSQTKTVVITPSAAAAPTVVPAVAVGSTLTVNGATTFQATITSSASTPPLGGTVTFTADTIPLTCGTPAVLTSFASTVSCVVSPLVITAGPHTLTAKYSNDPAFSDGIGSTSFTVSPGTTKVALTASPGTTTEVNQSVTYTATVTQATPASGPVPATGLTPKGSVTFYNALPTTASAVIPGCNGVLINAGVYPCSTASLSVSTTASPSTPITAVFTPSDNNFTGVTQASLNQIVMQDQSAISLTTAAASTFVDQAATFTATIAPLNTGATAPTGTVAFFYGGTSIPECPQQPITSSGSTPPAYTATCMTNSLPANTFGHPITATYLGDANFSAPKVPGNTVVQVVNPSSYTVAITTSKPTIVATQLSPTFTVAVNPVFPGGMAPPNGFGVSLNGTITLSVKGGDNSLPAPVCIPIPTSKTASGISASCTMAFSQNQSNLPFEVTATYAQDPNFSTSAGTGVSGVNPATQVVQDFAISAPTTNLVPTPTIPPTAIFVTQGYNLGASSNNDPFFTTTVNATATAYGGFSDKLGFSPAACIVKSFPTTSSAEALTCSGAATLSGGGAAISSAGFPLIFNTSASTVAGDYSVTLTATDTSVPTLTHTTTLFTVTVVPQTTAQAILVNAAETVDASFTVSSPNDSYNFKCSQAHLVSSSSPITITSLPGGEGLYCSPVNSNGTLASNTASFRIGNPNAIGSATAKLNPSSTEFHTTLATALGLPLIALAGCFGRRKYKDQQMIRLLGLALLIAGLSVATGCGSNGFTGAAYTPPKTALASGTYLIQVSATDTVTAKTYYSVVSVQLSAQ